MKYYYFLLASHWVCDELPIFDDSLPTVAAVVVVDATNGMDWESIEMTERVSVSGQ